MTNETRADPGINVDTNDPTPPYEQVRRQIIALVSSGALTPGDRLPPVRQLANDLGLATGTVARAYRELEADGWVQTRRGAGTRIARSLPTRDVADSEELASLAAEFVQRARIAGADDKTILEHVNRAM